MVGVSLACLAGILLVQFAPALPASAWGFPLLALILALLRRRRFVAAAGLGGLLWAWWHAAWLLAGGLPGTWEGVDLRVEGQVSGLVRERGAGDLRIPLRIRAVEVEGTWRSFALPVQVNWYRARARPEPGETWRLKVRLKQPRGFANPGGFDYERWLFRQGIRATGYVREDPANGRVAGAEGRPIDRLRRHIQRNFATQVAQSRTGPLLEALTIGVRDGLDESHWEVLRRTGTSHLMAISGLHVGLVSGLLFWLTRRLCSVTGACERCPAPVVAAGAGLLGAIAYGALAGFSIPTRRAVLMVGAVLLALLWRRGLRPGQSLCLALLAVLAIDPLSVLEAGFWLSFAAVALLVLFLADLRQGGYWGGLLRVQWVLGLGMFPLALLLFRETSLIAPLTNLLAVPWVGLVIVPLALLAVLVSLLSPALGVPLWQLADLLLRPLWQLLVAASHLPFSSWQGAVPRLPLLVIGLVGLFLMLWLRHWSLRLPALVLCLSLVFTRPPAPAHGSAWVSLLDVGQGLSAVVRTRHHVLVYDTGPRFPSGFNTGEAVLVPLLLTQGLKAVDRLVISHGDNDHIGGAASLYARLPVYAIRTSDPRQVPWARSRPCVKGESWRWDGVEFSFLYPEGKGTSGNDRSCVLRVQAGGHRLLLPGDIEAASERRLLASGQDLRADVLVAPHHGSLTSSTPAFVAAVAPRWVLFPVGYRNRWDFPRPEVVLRYESRGIAGLDTARHGAIQLRMEPGREPEPKGWREQRRRYWQAPL